MSRRPPVTGAARRRYESRTRHTDPALATIAAIERAIHESGAGHISITWEGSDVVMVSARTTAGGIVGGRAAVPEHATPAIAIMYAGATCIRALVEAKA